jgi:hypothetical protein
MNVCSDLMFRFSGLHVPGDTTDGYGWQCIFGQCPKRLTTETIRAGSFFE